MLTRNCLLASLPSPLDNENLGDLDHTAITFVPTANSMEPGAEHSGSSGSEQGVNNRMNNMSGHLNERLNSKIYSSV